MFSASVWSYQCQQPDLSNCQADSSTPTDRPRQMPFGRRRWACSAARPVVVGWWSGDVAATWRRVSFASLECLRPGIWQRVKGAEKWSVSQLFLLKILDHAWTSTPVPVGFLPTGLRRRVAATSLLRQPTTTYWSCRATGSAPTAEGHLPWPVRRCGTLCLTISEIRLLAVIASDAFGVLRECAI